MWRRLSAWEMETGRPRHTVVCRGTAGRGGRNLWAKTLVWYGTYFTSAIFVFLWYLNSSFFWLKQADAFTMSSPTADEENTPVVTATAIDTTLCERGILRSDLGNKPVMVKCGHCNHTGMTKTTSQMGACTFGSAFALLFLFFPLVWLPFVLPKVSSLRIPIICLTRSSLTQFILIVYRIDTTGV